MYNNIVKNIKSIIFLLNMFFIFGSEIMLYKLYGNYSKFIDRLTTRLASINILYVKIFQAFASNNSLIDNSTNNKLLKFTDNVPWDFSDIDLNQLVEMANKYNIQLRHCY